MRLLIALAAFLVAVGVAEAQNLTSICDIQEYDEQGLSPLQGQWVTVRGIVTCPPGYFQPVYTNFYIVSGECGINVFTFDPLSVVLSLGDKIEVSGEVIEYITPNGTGAVTEIFSPDLEVVLLSTGNSAPTPSELPLAEVNSEQNEGRLLVTRGSVIATNLPYSFYITDGFHQVEIYCGAPDSVSFDGISLGDVLCITGALTQYDRSAPYFDGYELMPRTTRDIQECSTTPVEEGSWGTIKALFR